ncbi:MAG: amino acid ABC transporter substrate-binding protein [Desulfuromonadaceae bacterium]|nr:amino acid ABC transporter substrate-binding protein [Desulfuromonadaceae bacterium]
MKYIDTLLLFLLLTSLFLFNVPPSHAAPGALQKAEIIRLGEQMYRQGILPSGKPMPAFIRGDVEVDSSAFSCSSCHLRAGLGSYEGGVVTPPTTGSKLYKPYRRPPSMGDTMDQSGRHIYAKTVQERPAYNRTTLASAMRFGVDPVGQTFNDVMPRYPLSDSDMSILIDYLEALSSQPSPGASSTEFRFATIITDDVTPQDRQALLMPLQNFIDRKNQQLAMYSDFIKFGYIPTAEMKYAFRKASLDIWMLKGPPATWQKQLTAYSTKKPVFAVLGGISNQNWKPVHDFCESERLPCLFPITNFPVVSETGWYTYYFNKGYAQEGEATARYLNRQESLRDEKAILQIVQDSEAGKALAAGFQSVWKEIDRLPVTTVTLTAAQLTDQGGMNKILSTHSYTALLLWTDARLLPNLKTMISRLSDQGIVVMSSEYLGKNMAAISENVRDRVLLTWPYRLTPYVGPKTGQFDAKVPTLTSAKDYGDRRITSRSVTMLLQATLQGLNRIYDNLYRDHLLDVMSMQMDLTVRDYERLSFGPGQRYVSKGCYIIQLGPGADPALIPRSEWVVQ